MVRVIIPIDQRLRTRLAIQPCTTDEPVVRSRRQESFNLGEWPNRVVLAGEKNQPVKREIGQYPAQGEQHGSDYREMPPPYGNVLFKNVYAFHVSEITGVEVALGVVVVDDNGRGGAPGLECLCQSDHLIWVVMTEDQVDNRGRARRGRRQLRIGQVAIAQARHPVGSYAKNSCNDSESAHFHPIARVGGQVLEVPRELLDQTSTSRSNP